MAVTPRNDMDALLRHAGLSLTPTQIDQLHEGWTFMAPQLDRVRLYGRGREAEPGHIFRPDVFGTEEI
ncbi:MAG: hypothetical protein H7251_05325 [Acetobacteraceae bacterium]|nr:hypothetical protein [Acetobacteraceae bacterium]